MHDMPSRTTRRPSPPAPRRALTAALVALVFVGLGCSATDDTSSPAEPTVATTSPTSPGALTDGQCDSRMPGEIVPAEEAVVRFSRSQVCPGWVTVVSGTPVAFENQDGESHTITITEGNLPDGAAVTDGVAEAGGTWVETFDTVGLFTYVTDAIPSFRGTIEVVDAGQ